MALPGFTADSMIHDGGLSNVVVGDLAFTNLVRGASSLSGRISVRLDFKEQGPPALPAANRVLVGQLHVRDVASGEWTISTTATSTLPRSFVDDPGGTALYDAVPGPFLVAPPTNALGRTTLDFAQPGLVPGQEVRFAVIGVWQPGAGYDPLAPAFTSGAFPIRWQMPMTRPELRSVIESL